MPVAVFRLPLREELKFEHLNMVLMAAVKKQGSERFHFEHLLPVCRARTPLHAATMPARARLLGACALDPRDLRQ